MELHTNNTFNIKWAHCDNAMLNEISKTALFSKLFLLRSLESCDVKGKCS